MVSYVQRYVGGDYEGVWEDLRGLGSIPNGLFEDCTAVERETMQRVARHVSRLAEQLTDLGLVSDGPLLEPPTSGDHAELDLLAGEIGTLPIALDACLRYVGAVSFMGDCPALDLWYEDSPAPGQNCGSPGAGADKTPDPLVIRPVMCLKWAWDEYREQREEDPALILDGFDFDFAPDELHKANISGATHQITLTERVADPVIWGVDGRPDISLVDYLRLSISWGGMPGWSFDPDHAPAALAGLRTSPDF
ncbi:hypothetical protein AB0H42_31265 [Nocardia sp. NPDC050799]|uniref:hypothetical protein n=1 Tax=Nocardia sp. NPDC050799 TaxID=3154842 RepID=UPI0033EC74AF